MGWIATWHRIKQNPMNLNRWQTFKHNKRGYWSLWLFSGLFLLSLCADIIANDKPLLVRYKESYYLPILYNYSELEFGGELDIPADYRDEYIQEIILEQGEMWWPLIRFSYDTFNYNLTVPAPSAPDSQNLLGTDDQSRDVLARLIYGFRISVLFAITLTIFSTIIGVAVGATQGYFGGRIDLYGQRFIEIWSGLPMLFLLIILASLVQPNFWWLLGIMLLFSWMALVDVVRAEFLRGRHLEYVIAAKALGQSHRAIMFKHILPNAMVATMTFMPFIFTGALTTLTSLDFLGFGLEVGSPSLGELIKQGKNNLQAPWLGITAFVSMSVILVLLVFIGEAARDAFDPRKGA
ncbi:ABC transporter permease [Moritella sp. 28]|nr:ABC transporter permease [Moritella sp. 28]